MRWRLGSVAWLAGALGLVVAVTAAILPGLLSCESRWGWVVGASVLAVWALGAVATGLGILATRVGEATFKLWFGALIAGAVVGFAAAIVDGYFVFANSLSHCGE